MQYQDWGLIEYAAAWDRQKELFDARVRAKSSEAAQSHADSAALPGSSALPGSPALPNTAALPGSAALPDLAIFCEHPHVYTLGKSGDQNNLLANAEWLAAHQATFFQTDRGGDITYHGPGQIVGYPIIDLEHFHIGLRQYIERIEESVIRFLQPFGLQGERLKGATGVWLDATDPHKARKICAIGVRSSRFITMHGLALNINTDLNYYRHINPCGFIDKGVTSLALETGAHQDMEACRRKLFACMQEVFGE